MKPYLNLSGNSNIASYENSDDSIHVIFKSGAQRNYLFNHTRPGRAIVERMKVLAVQGRGLNSYISTTVNKNYFKKW